jgi:galactose mutarotase-like enzyme
MAFPPHSMVMSPAHVLLRSGAARASIARRGGECRAWAVGDIDLLWPGDPAVWSGIAPILFPVVGWTRDGQVRVGGSTYQLGVHGFAAEAEFEVIQQAEDRAILALADAAQTRAMYPFSFRLEIEYLLTPTSMHIVLSAANTGDVPMPYAVGLHPGFNWPLAGSASRHRIIFEAAECGEVPVITLGGLFSARQRPVPLEQRVLQLRPDLFANEALCFLGVASRKLLYDNGAGQGLLITLDNFPHIALWARPPARFVAIEAWTGHGDPENFAGDLFEKPSMIILPPGARGSHAVRYEFLANVSQTTAALQEFAHLPKRL